MDTEGKRKIQVMKFVFMRENTVGEYWRVKKQNKTVNQEGLISVPLSYIGKTTGEVGFGKKVQSLILTVSSLGTLVKYN